MSVRRGGMIRDRRFLETQRLMEVDMAATEKDVKFGCRSGTCSCKEAAVDVRGKKFCSTACADGKNPCGCGHPSCKPKRKYAVPQQQGRRGARVAPCAWGQT